MDRSPGYAPRVLRYRTCLWARRDCAARPCGSYEEDEDENEDEEDAEGTDGGRFCALTPSVPHWCCLPEARRMEHKRERGVWVPARRTCSAAGQRRTAGLGGSVQECGPRDFKWIRVSGNPSLRYSSQEIVLRSERQRIGSSGSQSSSETGQCSLHVTRRKHRPRNKRHARTVVSKRDLSYKPGT